MSSDEIRVCQICDAEFMCNEYSIRRTCEKCLSARLKIQVTPRLYHAERVRRLALLEDRKFAEAMEGLE